MLYKVLFNELLQWMNSLRDVDLYDIFISALWHISLNKKYLYHRLPFTPSNDTTERLERASIKNYISHLPNTKGKMTYILNVSL